MTRIKICGITNIDDARIAVECGSHALGFNFYRPSPRFITPEAARRIISELPEDVLTVGVFVNEESPTDVERIAAEACVGAIQLHGDESPRYCRKIKALPVIKAFRVGADFSPSETTRYEVDSILLDAFAFGTRGGTGHTFDWTVARRARELMNKLYLAGGLTPDNVAEAIVAVRPYAVDVCSGVESKPGTKDAARLNRFVEAVRHANVKT
ncbi:MAG: phosphoribosylanthranilate isomerase [Pyrinomonadaceae bacterium]